MLKLINTISILLISLLIISCKSSNDLTMERGIYFYEKHNYSEAANQFNKVILSFPSNTNQMSIADLEIVAHAYQQLALSQSKLGLQSNNMENRKIYFQDAFENIQKAEDLATKPNKRQQYRKTLLGIQNQLNLLK